MDFQAIQEDLKRVIQAAAPSCTAHEKFKYPTTITEIAALFTDPQMTGRYHIWQVGRTSAPAAGYHGQQRTRQHHFTIYGLMVKKEADGATDTEWLFNTAVDAVMDAIDTDATFVELCEQAGGHNLQQCQLEEMKVEDYGGNAFHSATINLVIDQHLS